MQVKQITPYPQYSTNRVQRTEAKNPNFGLKIVYDEADVISVVGKQNAKLIRRAIAKFEEKLAERFQIIFKTSDKLKLMSHDNRTMRFKDSSGNINPSGLIDNWDTLELKPIFIKEHGKMTVELFDGHLRAFGDSSDKDSTSAAMIALSNGLDKYAEEKMAKSIVDKLLPRIEVPRIEATRKVQIIPPPEAIRQDRVAHVNAKT